MRYACAVAISCAAQLPIVHAEEPCEFEGAIIIADDYTNTYLGSVSHESDAESIFNGEGGYGSATSVDSVWNRGGIFGSEHSMYSARNPHTPSPPMILKDGKVVAYLTDNVSIQDAISLASLTERCSSLVAEGHRDDS